MSAPGKEHIIDAFHFEVGSVKDKKIKQRVIDLFANVSADIATRIATKIGANAPTLAVGSGVSAVSPALSQEHTKKSAMTRKVAILLDNGFCFTSVTQMMNALKCAGVATDLVSTHLGKVTAKDGMQLDAAKDLTTACAVLYDALYIPGGAESVKELMNCTDARNFINETFQHAKSIAASDEGADLLAMTDASALLSGLNGNKGEVKMQLGVVYVKDPTDRSGFSEEFIKLIAMHRHWARS